MKTPKTAAQRQADHQARLRALTPMERLWRTLPEGQGGYTSLEQVMALQAKTLSAQLQTICDRLNQRLVARITALPEGAPGRQEALAELQGSFARLQLPSH